MHRNYDQIKKYIEADVDSDLRLLISDFAILWNNYEKELFPDDEGNPYYKFSKVMNSYNNRICIADRVFNHMSYEYETEISILYKNFINYFNSTDGFFDLRSFKNGYCIRRGDISDEELKNLIDIPNLRNKYLLLMLMVGRVRNNMFHGIKILQNINKQKELFEICNRLLTLTLDITNTLIF